MHKVNWLNLCIALLLSHSVISAPPFREIDHSRTEVKEETFEETDNFSGDLRDREMELARDIQRERHHGRDRGSEIVSDIERSFREEDNVERDIEADIRRGRRLGSDIEHDIENDIESERRKILEEEHEIEREGGHHRHSAFGDEEFIRTPSGREMVYESPDGSTLVDERSEHTAHSSSRKFEEIIED